MEYTQAQEKRVLIVDDEAGIRRNLNVGLAQHGFAIDDVEDGLSALRRIEASYQDGVPYNYVVVDMVLPDINGMKLLEIIKSKYPTLPVIVISGYGTEITPEEVMGRHGDGYLSKPFLADDLATIMGKVAPAAIEESVSVDETVQKTSASGYAMIRIKEGSDVLSVFRSLTYMENVIYCDAVRNFYDIVLLLNGESSASLENIVQTKIKPIADISEIDYCAVTKPKIEEGVQDFIDDYEKQNSLAQKGIKAKRLPQPLSAYLLVEVAENRLNEVFPRLYFLDGVVSCDAVKGKYDLIVLIQATTFKEMERFVREEIRPLDGVIRTKLLNIMNMFEM
ncbi:MAG TPA: response regulator [Thermodesulfobacteriota bacterium]|nr:response regulator [Thermodesulfobacteriota bacterium]